jgi:hypothetical protein
MLTEWYVNKGDFVKVKLFEDHHNLIIKKGIIISNKFNDINMMFPCVNVYIFGLNETRRCYPHQLEVLSSIK